MSREEKINKENDIETHLRFCFLEKNFRHLLEYLGFGWQKINAVKSIPWLRKDNYDWSIGLFWFVFFTLITLQLLLYYKSLWVLAFLWKLDNITTQPSLCKKQEPLELSMVLNPDPSQLSLQFLKETSLFRIYHKTSQKLCII